MRILELDSDNVKYEAVSPEAEVYEEPEQKKMSVDDVLLVLVSVENDDTKETAETAVKDIEKFLKQLGRKRVMIYPYAHLSNNLARPKAAMEILNHMYKSISKDFEAYKAPFGWTKKPTFAIKGHPVAEQARSYGPNAAEKVYKKVKPAEVNTAMVRKSDWSGLPDTDHRKIGERLDLFSFQEVSPSMVYWHPNGHIIYRELIGFIRELESHYEYQETGTPVVANTALWHVSGHYEHYKDNMFMFENDMGTLGMKPMNCPSTILIYKSKAWSYRDLPFRTATFDKLYRKENSGSLTGLFRVMEMTQDDGHIFVTDEQLEHEAQMFLEFVKRVYSTFGMKFVANLSTMPEDHMGDEELWEKATNALKHALEKEGMKYEIKEKEGAFYGPKIDFDVFDSMNRKWQCATLQVDYQMPIRFGLEYIGEDGRPRTPIIIHRAALGSLERFIAVLTEHYQGNFPTWLAPTQVVVASLSQNVAGYAQKVYGELKAAGIRASLDISDKTLQYKIRDAWGKKTPYTVILGKKEEEAGTISIRMRDNKQKNQVKLSDFLASLKDEIKERKS